MSCPYHLPFASQFDGEEYANRIISRQCLLHNLFSYGRLPAMAKKFDVKRLRERLNLTQEGLAERLGVHQSTIARIEAGQMVPSKPVQILLEQIAS
jgi:DNA-binding XRE family transcriptional regulator